MKNSPFFLIIGLLSFLVINVKADVSFVEIGTIAKISYDVIEGQVVNVQCAWDEQDEAIYTIVTIDVTKSYKNKLKGEIEVKDIGGKIGDLITINPFQAQYNIGEEIIVCVAKKDKKLQTQCSNQGKFVINTIENKKIVQRYVDFTRLLLPENLNEKSLIKEFDYNEFRLIIQNN